MKLELNMTISHYKILSPIGEGGMGVVYRAADERLDREVAIKVLTADFANDEDRLARFEQEARATSALNHPNILTVYDIGEHEGSPFIVSELLEGEELRERLESGSIPGKKAIEYARQIASGLSAAHEKGIVHRDLKPENIFITSDERAKILDFGIAKLTEKEPVKPGSEDATRKALTNPGMVLGTAAYMSPEQVRGEVVDHRSDIFSFGSILREMLTGKRTFHRGTMAETMAAILNDEPEEISETNPNVNPAVSGIIERCLEKKPEQRFQSTKDLGFALENLAASSGISSQHSRQNVVEKPSRTVSRLLPVIAAVVIFTGLFTAIGMWYLLNSEDDPHKGMTLSIGPPEGKEFRKLAGVGSVAAISPDGRSLLLNFEDEGELFVRRLDSTALVKVPGSEGGVGNQPTWKDDSTITFPRFGKGWISVRFPDGAPEPVTNIGSWTRGGSWSRKGSFIYSSNEKLWMGDSDRKSVEVKGPAGRKGMWLYPDFVGDSDDFLVLFIPEDGSDGEIWLATLSGNEMTDVAVLFKNESQAQFTPYAGGRVLFVRDDNLYSQALDISARSMADEPELIVEQVASQQSNDMSRADFSVSDNGVVVWRSGQTARAQITVFNRDGDLIDTAGPAGSYYKIEVSPTDDTRLFVEPDSQAGGLVEVGQSGMSDLPRDTSWLGWTSDGKSIAGTREGQLISRDVTDNSEKVIGSLPPDVRQLKALSADEKLVLHFCKGAVSICVSELGKDGAFGNTKALINSDEFHPVSSFSPDGKYVVYRVTGDIPSRGMYVQRFPGTGRRTLISQDTGTPIWRGDGKEIVYSEEGAVWSITVSGSGDDLSFGEPKKLFGGLRYPANLIQQSVFLQISRDGSKIYFLQAVEQPKDGLINILFGF